MKPLSVALLVHGTPGSQRNALAEEKYRDLALAFVKAGFDPRSVLYHDAQAETIYSHLLDFNAILVWVNPIEEGVSRKKLDSMLTRLLAEGRFVSTNPEVIVKIGGKDVLFKTRNMGWTGEINLYSSYQDFVARFPGSLEKTGIAVLKQYRGNGGNGVFKIRKSSSETGVTIVHAKQSTEERTLSWAGFFEEFQSYFANDGFLVEQEWNNNLVNGMVRCYLCGNKVVGFGYQEINALYEVKTDSAITRVPPGQRYYFTQNCGLFADLKEAMETNWVAGLQKALAITDEMLPVIWDADFFINQINSGEAPAKYSLCEINVSCVSPFPPSAIPFIVQETERRIK